MSSNTVMNIFIRAMAETRSIPLTIVKRRDTRREFGDMLNSMHQAAIERDEPELTLEEINAEIVAARSERSV